MQRETPASSLSREAIRVEVRDPRGDEVGLSPPEWVAALTGREAAPDRVQTPHARAGLAVSVNSGREATHVGVSLADFEPDGPAAFSSLVVAMITTAFGRLRASPHPHAARVWNFLPGIHDPLATGVNRYMVFNMARHAAFVELFGATAVRTGAVPTASCVGHGGRSVAVHVLGAGEAGQAVENPRQTPAFLYSGRFGPRPPCFSRATTSRLGGVTHLLVGGTASVRGEESMHEGDREAQLRETLTNLRAIIARARGGAPHGGDLGGIAASRVYYKRASDRAWLLDALPAAMSHHVPAELVRAEICREELLLEIELVVRLEPVGSASGPTPSAALPA